MASDFFAGELIQFIEGSTFSDVGNLPHAYNQMNSLYHVAEPEWFEDLTTFTSFEAEFYPDLFNSAQAEIAAWMAERIVEAEKAKEELQG